MALPDLDLWMNGEYVGAWYWTRGGVPVLRYDESWLRSPQVRPLSLSLPIPAGEKEVRGPAVEHYFDNLLPDARHIRERLRRRFRVTGSSAAELLAAIGRDCVGALQLMPAGEAPPPFDRIESQPLREAQVAAALRQVTVDNPTPDSDADLRISIAGAQEKTALLYARGQWRRPLGATPTTHIFKLPLGLIGNLRADMHDSVENEWLCAQILNAWGLPAARCEIGRFEDQKALVVERFDRRWMPGRRWIARLPQEDFCQATGTPAERKYESDGGPGLRQSLALLSASETAQADSLRFALTQLAFWLLAATDGHAKNFSLFLEGGDRYTMAPLYDVLSAWPIIGRGPNHIAYPRARLAMALRAKNAHYHLAEVQTRHWQLLATQTGVAHAFEQMVALVAQALPALDVLESTLPPDFPPRIWEAVRNGVRTHCQRFEAGLG
ncbi:type II toxin-antitoxin system HipA family toxin [Pseudorhodoferax sp. Leaf267]|uniref:type II toxin-antitoxin system HipA family toxin n=1 Tax=Pseudorhodoferax sp. Leaf267 TaxID=1736316 RepID=UPI0006F5D924|nr:type II toxin-antitoxin system HipA family toxin [Pseudorhodoferax sp. Leaf267]KQP13089.1 toxin HipA [Pseudorhodoferax sp. Leaf267]